MALKNKKKVYLSFPKSLLDFMEEEISKKNILLVTDFEILYFPV